MSNQISVIGMSWYKEHDYQRLRDIFDDGDKLPFTYTQWLQNAQYGFDELTSKGHIVVKAYIDPESFTVWCVERGYRIDSKARNQFAIDAANTYIKSRSR